MGHDGKELFYSYSGNSIYAVPVKEVAGALQFGGSHEAIVSGWAAANPCQYRTTLTKKAVLIVVDDVWRSSDLEPFLAENSPRSRLLFTTRDASIAAAVGAREHLAELLTEQKSREVLTRWAGTEVCSLPPIASDLIHECGYLPLALSMVGAMVRGKPPAMWKPTSRWKWHNRHLRHISRATP